jgi:hypothetical protein
LSLRDGKLKRKVSETRSSIEITRTSISIVPSVFVKYVMGAPGWKR